jgi:hypothetical protein
VALRMVVLAGKKLRSRTKHAMRFMQRLSCNTEGPGNDCNPAAVELSPQHAQHHSVPTLQRSWRHGPDQDASIIIPHSKAVGAFSHPAGAGGLGVLVLSIESNAEDAFCSAHHQHNTAQHSTALGQHCSSWW